MADVKITVLTGDGADAADALVDMAEQIRAALAAAVSFPVSVLKLDTPDALLQALAEPGPKSGSRHHLVLYDPVEAALARGMAQGRAPSRTLEQWKHHASALLPIYRKNRKKIILASAPGITADPGSFWAALALHFTLDNAPDKTALTGEPAWASWQAVLARQAVVVDSAAIRLNGELEAGALQLAEPAIDVDAAFADIEKNHAALARAQKDQAALAEIQTSRHALQDTHQQDHDQLSAERDLLLRQLDEIQTELKAQFSAVSTHQAIIAQMKQQMETTNRTMQGLRGETEALQNILREAREILRIRERELQQEREKSTALEDLLTRLHEQVHTNGTEIDALRNSTSWKLTQPIRGVKRILAGQ